MSVSKADSVALGDLVALGRVTRPHGVRGEVRVHPYWSEGETLEQGEGLWLRTAEGARPIAVRSVRRANAVLLMNLGAEDRDGAEALRGAELCVPRTELPELEEGEYYLVDLIGARVEHAGELVGTVVELRLHPSVDAVVIQTPKGKRLEQVLAEPWILSVDTAAKVIQLSSLDGLI